MRSILFAAVAVGLAGPLAAQSSDSQAVGEVRTVVEGFHAALAAGDSASALAYLHPDVVIFEGGRAETLTQYRSGHLRGDMAFASATDRQVADHAVEVAGDQALYTATSRTTGNYRDRAVDSTGTETMVLVRTDAGWRIRHIHWSSR